ncbi:MAG: FAD-binding oxidoreductase [Longimicrobiales bacterium]|nr:FAD-binding oxidoreductase [Longimicrobiales bacterium]
MTVAETLSALLPGGISESEWTPATAWSRPPEAVVRPGSIEEVAMLMEWATREEVGVLPVGSGERTRPVMRTGRYVVLSTERLSGIHEYEAANLTLTVGAGTPFSQVQAALSANGQWAPFDPPHVQRRSVGGLVAAGVTGPLWMGYGELRNHVLGMTVVTGDGRVLRLGGRVVKNVAGYDLLKAVVGSRGSLAVITSAVLRAFPQPQVDRLLVLEGPSVEDLMDAALEVGTAPVLPVSSVLVDRLPGESGKAALVVRLHGARDTVDADQERLERHVGHSFREAMSLDVDGLRDHAADGEVVVLASSLPSRLPSVLEALASCRPAAIHADSYGGRVRAALPADAAEALPGLQKTMESLDGALRVSVTAKGGPEASAPGGTEPTLGEAALIRGLYEAFDPRGALWPARR